MIGPLVGMVHLGPLPGSPRFEGDLDALIAAAVSDARVLEAAGFDALLVENFGDAPYFADDVPAVTVAAMTRVVSEVRAATAQPIGVNVLRNDSMAALAVAAAAGADFIRVNVLVGTMFTDQGIITGRAAELARARRALDVAVEIAADVMVKHAVPPVGLTLERAARETWGRGAADALVVSGGATGDPIRLEDVALVKQAVPEAPILVGSGVTADRAAAVLAEADGIIVGTSIKSGGVTVAPVDPGRARAFVEAARSPAEEG